MKPPESAVSGGMNIVTQVDSRPVVTRRGLTLTWLCQTCGEPVKNRTGYVTVDETTAVQRAARVAQRKREDILRAAAEGSTFTFTNLNDLLDLYPAPVPWEGYHRDCDPFPDRADYFIEVERIRTLPQMVDWAAHLMGKRWIDHTDWDNLLRKVGVAA